MKRNVLGLLVSVIGLTVGLASCSEPSSAEVREEFRSELVELSSDQQSTFEALQPSQFFHADDATHAMDFGWTDDGVFYARSFDSANPEGEHREFDTQMKATEDGAVVMVLNGNEMLPFSTFTPEKLAFDTNLKANDDVTVADLSWSGNPEVNISEYSPEDLPTGILRPMTNQDERNAWMAEFEVELAAQAAEEEQAAAAEEAEPATSSSDSADWAEILDTYEDTIDAIIAASEKLETDPNDATALNDLNQANMRALELSDQLNDATGELSARQTERLAALSVRLMEEAR